MATRFRATVELTYPTPASLKVVLAAGGMTKLSEEQRAKVTLKRVPAGSYCDDIPEKSIKKLLARGHITEVGADKKKTKRT